MTVTVSHAFNCAIADDPADISAGKVLPSHWNDSHTVANALDKTGDTMTGALAINLGTITVSNPAWNITQTWNDGAVTFTGLKLNVTATASAAGSLLMDLQAGGTSQFWVRKDGVVASRNILAINDNAGSGWVWAQQGTAQFFQSGGKITWSDGDALGGTADITLARAAANILGVTNYYSGGGAVQLTEMTAPSAGASNTARIYCEDNGAGKTRLMVQFASGAAQQIAIEP
jgi:hypothetical protein